MTDTVLPVTNPSDMLAVLQHRTNQLALGLQQFPVGISPQQIKDHIVSMYQVSDILLEAWNKLQAADEAESGQETNGEDRAH